MSIKINDNGSIAQDQADGEETLKSKDRWILREEEGKVPKSPSKEDIDPLDPDNWMGYEEAKEYVEMMNGLELGFVFVEEDDIIGIDLDDVVDPREEEVEDWAKTIIEKVGGLWEVSMSGTRSPWIYKRRCTKEPS